MTLLSGAHKDPPFPLLNSPPARPSGWQVRRPPSAAAIATASGGAGEAGVMLPELALVNAVYEAQARLNSDYINNCWRCNCWRCNCASDC